MPQVKPVSSLHRLVLCGAVALLALSLAAPLAGCSALPGLLAPTPTPTATPTNTPTPTPTRLPTATPTATPTRVPLAVSTRLDPASVPQGQLATLLVEPNRSASLSATLQGRPLPLFQEGARWYALVPVWAGTPVGTWSLVITATDPQGGPPLTEHRELHISASQFELEEITLSPTTLSLLQPDIVGPENEFMAQLLAPGTPKRLWQGPFLRPVPGIVTSTYGLRRSYNGGPASDYHGGLDLGITEGEPVAAANAGKVAFAGPLKVRGNVVVIDHGWGLYSGYCHLSAVAVTTGQDVERGQTIGLVGSTGLSTGPHLHWETWLGGEPIDPTYLEEWELP